MKFKNGLRIAIGSVLFLLLAFVSWQVLMNPVNSEALTVEEAEQIATERFNAEVTDTKLNQDVYEITFELDTGEYQIEVSKSSGEVLDVNRIQKETPEQDLTEEDIKEIIEQKEIGEIEDIHKAEENEETSYEAIVINEQQKTYLTLDGETGEVTKREEEEKEEKGQSDEDEKEDTPESSDEEEQKNLTSEEAVQIALDTVYGEVDDIDLEDEDGQLYYYIEIETDDDLEAEIQIHAITGEVISIEWDD